MRRSTRSALRPLVVSPRPLSSALSSLTVMELHCSEEEEEEDAAATLAHRRALCVLGVLCMPCVRGRTEGPSGARKACADAASTASVTTRMVSRQMNPPPWPTCIMHGRARREERKSRCRVP